MTRPIIGLALAGALGAVPVALGAQAPDSAATAARTPACTSCAEWNVPQRPFRVYGNTYYVGTHGLSAVLVTSPQGHVLLDGGLPDGEEPAAGD